MDARSAYNHILKYATRWPWRRQTSHMLSVYIVMKFNLSISRTIFVTLISHTKYTALLHNQTLLLGDLSTARHNGIRVSQSITSRVSNLAMVFTARTNYISRIAVALPKRGRTAKAPYETDCNTSHLAQTRLSLFASISFDSSNVRDISRYFPRVSR